MKTRSFALPFKLCLLVASGLVAACSAAVAPGDAAPDGGGTEGGLSPDVVEEAPACLGAPPSVRACPNLPLSCPQSNPNCGRDFYRDCVLPADRFPAGSTPSVLCDQTCFQASTCPPRQPGAPAPDESQCRCGNSPACGSGFYCVSTPANPTPHCECATTYARLP